MGIIIIMELSRGAVGATGQAGAAAAPANAGNAREAVSRKAGAISCAQAPATSQRLRATLIIC